MIDDIRRDGSAESGFKQVKRIAVVTSAHVRVDYKPRKRVHTGSKLDGIKNPLIVANILRAHPCVFQEHMPVFAIL